MKTIRNTSLLALLLFASASCLGSTITETVSKESAKTLGAWLTASPANTNQVEVVFQFVPNGELQNVVSVTLDVSSGERKLLSATLSPSKQAADLVVYRFTIDPTYLAGSSLRVCYKDGGWPPYGYYVFRLGDFIAHQ